MIFSRSPTIARIAAGLHFRDAVGGVHFRIDDANEFERLLFARGGFGAGKIRDEARRHVREDGIRSASPRARASRERLAEKRTRERLGEEAVGLDVGVQRQRRAHMRLADPPRARRQFLSRRAGKHRAPMRRERVLGSANARIESAAVSGSAASLSRNSSNSASRRGVSSAESAAYPFSGFAVARAILQADKAPCHPRLVRLIAAFRFSACRRNPGSARPSPRPRRGARSWRPRVFW